jgi:hypothetical protein
LNPAFRFMGFSRPPDTLSPSILPTPTKPSSPRENFKWWREEE